MKSHMPKSCTAEKVKMTKTPLKRKLSETEEETGICPDGEMATSGRGTATESGFGGLGLEGMVGSEDPDGEITCFPGEGNSGAISGGKLGEEGCRGSGGNDGAAEMVDGGNDDDKAREK